MKEYHKIETLFARDMDGSKKLIEGTFRDDTIQFLKDNQWVWTEKVDGTNIRIQWDGHEVTFGGRTDNAQIPASIVNYLNATFKTDEVEQIFEQKFGETPVILFGEGYGAKIQKVGSLYRDDVSFILFDVQVGDVWLRRDSVEDIATALGIDVVPIVGTGTLQEAVKFVKSEPRSFLNKNAPMEGVVARPQIELINRMGHRVIVKIKVKDFAKN